MHRFQVRTGGTDPVVVHADRLVLRAFRLFLLSLCNPFPLHSFCPHIAEPPLDLIPLLAHPASPAQADTDVTFVRHGPYPPFPLTLTVPTLRVSVRTGALCRARTRFTMGCLGTLFSRRQKPKRASAARVSTDAPRDAPTPPTLPSPTPPSPLSAKLRKNMSWRATTTNMLPACDPVRLLGEGTFGTVVLVRERSTRQFFAVKVMNKSQLVHESQLDNIALERQVLRDAGPHPFVVECHSGFQTKDAVVLVLEYLSGGDMYDLMKAYGTLTEDQARFYLAETVVGVAELHSHGFVFRDLKLENILLDARGHVRLTDFGLAGRAVSPGWDDRSITDISGTAIYQAPEILSGSGHGTVVDWWALGVLAYVLLTGRPPFPNDGSREELYRKIANEQLDLDADPRLEHVSADCRDFVARLLLKNPALRLGSAKDAMDVKQHPFFNAIDFDALLRFETEPPLVPPRRGPASADAIPQQDAEHAQQQVERKLTNGRKPVNRHIARIVKTRGKVLDELEYKPVSVTPPPEENERRISIGLDFGGRNTEAGNKTWTGTTDDFGRKVNAMQT